MNHERMRDLSVPFKIPSEAISLPTRGATVTKCTLFHEGDMDPEPFSKLYGLTFTADV